METQEHKKRLFHPYADAKMEAIKRRKLENGVEHILPSPGRVGAPLSERALWTANPIQNCEFERLSDLARQAEVERQLRINQATYQTTSVGPIKEFVLNKET